MSTSSAAESGILETEGGPLYYEVTGQGHPVLLIHAGIADHTMWDAQWGPFARRHRVIRYDTRGFGASPVPGDGRPFSDRQDIYELMRHLGAETAHLVGASRAGKIATDFTLEHPEMVSALVSVCGGLSGFESSFSEIEAGMFAEWEEAHNAGDFDRATEIEVRVWVDGPGQPVGRAGPVIREKVRAMIDANERNHPVEGSSLALDPPAIGRLGQITVPTLVTIGDLDVNSAKAAAEKLLAGIPGARGYTFRGVAHLPAMESPEEFNQVVLGFFDEIEGMGKNVD